MILRESQKGLLRDVGMRWSGGRKRGGVEGKLTQGVSMKCNTIVRQQSTTRDVHATSCYLQETGGRGRRAVSESQDFPVFRSSLANSL